MLLASCRRSEVRRPVEQIPLSESVPRSAHSAAFTTYGRASERPPSDLSPDLLADEAVLSISPFEFCFEVVVRAPRTVDQSLEMFEYECSVDGPDTIGFVRESAAPLISEHHFIGEAPTLFFSGPHASLSLPYGEPSHRVFRVSERRGQVCCPAVPTESLELTMAGRVGGLRGAYARLEWQWELVRARGIHSL